MTEKTLTVTEAFDLAYRFVTETNMNIFLTGKAGTGKTTFLKYLRENSVKEMVVAAPTGVAAINAGGVTLHSLFQLPFAPFIPAGKPGSVPRHKHSLLSQVFYQDAKLRLFRGLELLVIDESSMVASHTVDAIDMILRSTRRRHSEPFGGVQVLFIGDLFQLPPVVKNDEWTMLKDYYESIFFFDSHVLRQNIPVMIELKEIFRQHDDAFIEILNQVRHNNLSKENGAKLNSRLQRNFIPYEKDKFITLTTHNAQADELNRRKLNQLKEVGKTYTAEITGQFPEYSYPAEEKLELKIGAQVMFLKNDIEAKQYFNGKIGTISNLGDDSVRVRCEGDSFEINVRKQDWKNIKYSLDKSTHAISEEELGSFSQYPLRLAWAITIHKSQGLTFPKLIVDAQNAFANGQVYVALSRCTSLEGLVLTSPVNEQYFGGHKQLKDWQEKNHDEENLAVKLSESRMQFGIQELLGIFQWKKWSDELNLLRTVASESRETLDPSYSGWLCEIQNKFLEIESVAEKFRNRVMHLLGEQPQIEENEALQKRIGEAAVYFYNAINKWKNDFLEHRFSSPSKKTARKVDVMLQEVSDAVNNSLHLTGYCRNGFKLNEYLHHKKNNPPQFGKIRSSYQRGKDKDPLKVDTDREELYAALAELRDRIATERKVPNFLIFNNSDIYQVCAHLPANKNVMEKLQGFGPSKVNKYGDEIIELVKAYCEEHSLSPAETISKKLKIKTGLSVTVDATIALIRDGKSPEEAAKERNLALGTIEGHLALAIQLQTLDISEVLPMEEVESIADKIKKVPASNSHSLTNLKENLPRDISYGKIRMVQAWMQRSDQLKTKS